MEEHPAAEIITVSDAKEEDISYIRDYWYSRYLFIATHQPLFLENARKFLDADEYELLEM